MEDELDMETQLERELAAEQEELLEVEEEDEEDVTMHRRIDGDDDDDDEDKERESIMENEKIKISAVRPGLAKVRSLPANFIYNPPRNIDGKNIIIYCNSLTIPNLHCIVLRTVISTVMYYT